MNNSLSDALEKFGLPAKKEFRKDIISSLQEEINFDEITWEMDIDGTSEHRNPGYTHCLCLQLFSIGDMRDCFIIFKANPPFTRHEDIHFLAGAGIIETIKFLEQSKEEDAEEIYNTILSFTEASSSEALSEWSPEKIIKYWKEYYN